MLTKKGQDERRGKGWYRNREGIPYYIYRERDKGRLVANFFSTELQKALTEKMANTNLSTSDRKKDFIDSSTQKDVETRASCSGQNEGIAVFWFSARAEMQFLLFFLVSQRWEGVFLPFPALGWIDDALISHEGADEKWIGLCGIAAIHAFIQNVPKMRLGIVTMSIFSFRGNPVWKTRGYHGSPAYSRESLIHEISVTSAPFA